MSAIRHHIPDEMLAAYASGSLPHAFAVVVASHVSMCEECRAGLEAHQAVGGALLESETGIALSQGLKADVLAELDKPFRPEPIKKSGTSPTFQRQLPKTDTCRKHVLAEVP